MKSHTSKIDLTDGPIWKRLLAFFLPIAAGTLMQQLYNAADSLILARFVGTNAFAAVGGSVSQIINVLIGFFVAFTGGASVIIAQFYGAGRHGDVKKAMGSALIMCTWIAAGLTAIGVFGSELMLRLLNTPEDTLEGATTYLTIYFTGVFFILILNMESNYLRAVGDSAHPFIYMLAACASNIVMDYVFVRFFGWGIAGVAIATVIAQVLNAALLTWKIFTVNEDYRLIPADLRRNRPFNGQMLRVGIPSGLQYSMFAVSKTIVQASVNGLGTLVVASWAMSGKVDAVFWSISGALGTSITTFVGQNHGAGKETRVKGCLKQSMIIMLIHALTMSACMLLLGTPIIRILTDDEEVVTLTYRILTYFAPYYFIWTLVEVFGSVMRGLGDAIPPTVIIGIGVCLLRAIVAIVIFPIFGNLEILATGYVVSWAVTGIAMTVYFLLNRK